MSGGNEGSRRERLSSATTRTSVGHLTWRHFCARWPSDELPTVAPEKDLQRQQCPERVSVRAGARPVFGQQPVQRLTVEATADARPRAEHRLRIRLQIVSKPAI